MKIIWNDQSVSWFNHASAYTGFHQKLADLLLKHITVRETLCDIGCVPVHMNLDSPIFTESARMLLSLPEGGTQ